MCGIAGYVSPDEVPENRAQIVRTMLTRLVHRGPDDEGLVHSGPGTLGMRRLAVFDPAGGHQPMVSPDGRWHLVFNGAIYNHRTWRQRLAPRWTFRTQCDTEALLAALALEGLPALRDLRGMYAFALWDAREQRLMLGRDPLGIKPLYWMQDDRGGVLFASELGALRTTPAGRSATPDPTAAALFLAWLAVPAPFTLWQGMRALLPGETLIWHEGRLSPGPRLGLADVPSNPHPPAPKTAAEFHAQLAEQLAESVAAHLQADVPVGTFLSGGLDSAIITALAADTLGRPIKTFTIGFDEQAHDESALAAETARWLGTEHREERINGARVRDDLDSILAALDQPSGDGINTYYACQAARAGGVTVALSGMGADELFGGYPSFQRAPRLDRVRRLLQILPRPVRHALLAPLRHGNTGARKLADTLRHAGNLGHVALLQRQVFDDDAIRRLTATTTTLPPHPGLETLATETTGRPPGDTVSVAEIRGYMSDVLLRDSDVMSMRHSLELRVPFVDGPLLHWTRGQPDRYRFPPGRPKAALHAAMAHRLPPALVNRRKRGFSPPMARWMKAELRPYLEDTFSPARLARQTLVAAPAILPRWRDFLAGRDDRAWSRLWSLATLLHFITPAR